MKKSIIFLTMALLLLTSGFGWAQTRTEISWTASEQGYENAQEISTVAFDDNVSGEFAKGTNKNAPKYYIAGAAIRCYGGNYFTVSSEYNLTQIVIAFGSSDGSNAITTDCGTYESGTWTGTANSVTFTIGGTSGNRRIAGLAITYSAEAPEVLAPTFSPAGGTYTEAQSVSISCETAGATIFFTMDNSTPDTDSDEYDGPINISETTTVKAIAYVGEAASTVTSATYTILTPKTIAEAREQGTGSVFTAGTVTSCVGTTGYIQDATAAICVYGASLTVGDNITVQGTLTTYSGLLEITNPTVNVVSSGNTIDPEVMTIAEINASDNQGWFVRIEEATVTAISGKNTTINQDGNTVIVYDIKDVELAENDIVSLNGNIGNHNGIQIANPSNVTILENGEPTITVNPTTINVPFTEADGTITVTATAIDNELGFEFYWYEADGTTNATYDWVVAEFNNEGNIDYVIEANTGEARSAYMKVYGLDENANDVYSNLVTFNQEAYVAPAEPGDWVLTDLTELTENDVFVIVGTHDADNSSYAMSNDNGTSSAPAAVAVTVVNNTLAGEPADNIKWNLSVTENGYIFYPNGTTDTWLYCTNANNGVRVGTNSDSLFVMDEGTKYLKHTATGRYIGIYNKQDWRCYTNTTGNTKNQSFTFFKKAGESDTETYTLAINGYEAGSDGGYYLIASPVTVNPATVGMTDGNYDLYSFDATEEEEWRNYKAEPFNLVPGKGYLYAKQATNEGEVFNFELSGTPYDGTPITLTKDENGDFPGWNLLGNPFGETAYINRDFYVMKEDGSEIITGEGNEIAPMQGFFVIANEDGEELTIGTEPIDNTGSKIVINVHKDRAPAIDRAVIRVNNGDRLPKIMLNPNSTKLYFTEDGDDFAVIRSERAGRLHVAFKPSEDGEYTFSINTENLNMLYLHLIDNETGRDIDLLRNPSYSFFAKTNNKPNRFELAFKTGIKMFKERPFMAIKNAGDFCYYSNGEIVINGSGILQVIDLNGRIIKSETVNGQARVNMQKTKGIYVIRLLQNDQVKSQKIVID